MKKIIAIIGGIIIGLFFILQLTVRDSPNITFPFDVTEVVHIEMYHYEGVPAAEECKIITQKEDIERLYQDFQKIKVRDVKESAEPMTGGSATRFEFILSDNSVYELESINDGVHQTLHSKTENFKYLTSANIEKYWEQFSYEVVEKPEDESNFLSIDEYNEKYAAE